MVKAAFIILLLALAPSQSFGQGKKGMRFVSAELLGLLPTSPKAISYGKYLTKTSYVEGVIARHDSAWANGRTEKALLFLGLHVGERAYLRGGVGYRKVTDTISTKEDGDVSDPIKKDFDVSASSLGVEVAMGTKWISGAGMYWGLEILSAFIPVAPLSKDVPESEGFVSSHDENPLDTEADMLASGNSGTLLSVHIGYAY